MAGCANSDLAHLRDSKTGAVFPGAWGKSPVTQFRALATPAVLTSVQSGSLEGYDRIVFTFSGRNVPSYVMSYQGEGNKQTIVFDIRFGARSTRPNGKASFVQHQPVLNYPTVKALSQAKAGEESTSWMATLSHASDYRVTELSQPPRVIIDFKH